MKALVISTLFLMGLGPVSGFACPGSTGLISSSEVRGVASNDHNVLRKQGKACCSGDRACSKKKACDSHGSPSLVTSLPAKAAVVEP